MTKSVWENKYLKNTKFSNEKVSKGEFIHSLLEQRGVGDFKVGMSEQEIMQKLCFYIFVVEGNPIDNSFFNRCYNICMSAKDKITEIAMWEIVDREYILRMEQERKFIDSLKRYIN